MREVELIFSYKRRAIGSWLIRWWLDAPYSHVAIKFYSNYMELDLVYEANLSGVRILPYQTWLDEHNVPSASKSFQMEEGKLKSALQKAFSRLEKPYGKLTILGIMLKGQDIGNDGEKSFICSELAHEFLDDYLPEIRKFQDYITPKDLWSIVV